jgi:hypothetical protein
MAAIRKPERERQDFAVELVERMLRLDAEGLNPYPNDALFLEADAPDLGQALREAFLEDNPIIVVYPDGQERLIEARDPFAVPQRGD